MNAALEKIVHLNLDSAIANGYTEILEWPAEDIAVDLLAYAEDCSSHEVEMLLPCILTWLEKKRIK